MPSNIEIKAVARDFSWIENKARTMADSEDVLHQEDVFFTVERGRLKLRKFSDHAGELIYYERPDQAGPKQSNYLITPTSDPKGLETVLSAALGIVGVVRKKRRLLLVGQTRVHLDEVEGLGSFMELEVVLQPGQPPEQGEAIAFDLMEKLGVKQADLIDRAYIDLILEKKKDV